MESQSTSQSHSASQSTSRSHSTSQSTSQYQSTSRSTSRSRSTSASSSQSSKSSISDEEVRQWPQKYKEKWRRILKWISEQPKDNQLALKIYSKEHYQNQMDNQIDEAKQNTENSESKEPELEHQERKDDTVQEPEKPDSTVSTDPVKPQLKSKRVTPSVQHLAGVQIDEEETEGSYMKSVRKKVEMYADAIGYGTRLIKEFSKELSKVTPEQAEAEAQVQVQAIESSDDEIIPDTDEDEDIHSKVQDIILNEDIFGSEESSSKEPESVVDVVTKISIEAGKKSEGQKTTAEVEEPPKEPPRNKMRHQLLSSFTIKHHRANSVKRQRK